MNCRSTTRSTDKVVGQFYPGPTRGAGEGEGIVIHTQTRAGDQWSKITSVVSHLEFQVNRCGILSSRTVHAREVD